jgi:peptidoglycan hydrolase-like protein with peptidoglycan-binding domain
LIVAFSVALFAGRGVYAQTPSTAASGSHRDPTGKKSSTSKKKPTARKPTQTSSTSASRRTSTSKTASKTTKRTPPPRVVKQQQPTPERYKEIQQALADRGYFKGQPDGTWGPESVDALKRFQREQNLVEDGKIGSLSLIALGLGPKRNLPESAPEKPAQPQ